MFADEPLGSLPLDLNLTVTGVLHNSPSPVPPDSANRD